MHNDNQRLSYLSLQMPVLLVETDCTTVWRSKAVDRLHAHPARLRSHTSHSHPANESDPIGFISTPSRLYCSNLTCRRSERGNPRRCLTQRKGLYVPGEYGRAPAIGNAQWLRAPHKRSFPTQKPRRYRDMNLPPLKGASKQPLHPRV